MKRSHYQITVVDLFQLKSICQLVITVNQSSMINKYSLNDRVSTIDNYLGTIRYIGNLPVWGTNTVALGIEWDDPSRGKNNGDLNGIQYFTPWLLARGHS